MSCNLYPRTVYTDKNMLQKYNFIDKKKLKSIQNLHIFAKVNNGLSIRCDGIYTPSASLLHGGRHPLPASFMVVDTLC